MPAHQSAWGGKTTGPPVNQVFLARGSTETMVMFGRLKDKSEEVKLTPLSKQHQQDVKERTEDYLPPLCSAVVLRIWSCWKKKWNFLNFDPFVFYKNNRYIFLIFNISKFNLIKKKENSKDTACLKIQFLTFNKSIKHFPKIYNNKNILLLKAARREDRGPWLKQKYRSKTFLIIPGCTIERYKQRSRTIKKHIYILGTSHCYNCSVCHNKKEKGNNTKKINPTFGIYFLEEYL